MVGANINSRPIQILVNYWECRPTLMGARLDRLLRAGVTQLATFVPWQAVESDISHTLTRFLQAVADRKMTVSLILTPEVGVHYPNSGLPRDIFSKPENIAQHFRCGGIPVQLPPNLFCLPSLAAPEFNKRYHNFLSRVDSLLAGLVRTQPQIADSVTTVLTGGFWKYYREPRSVAGQMFSGIAGDFCSSASVTYRQRTDQFFAQKEFADPTPAAANRWKTRALEDVNRRWFNQHAEDVFRNRSAQFVRRKAAQIPLQHVELFTPEADPSLSYSNFLQAIAGGNGDFSRLSAALDQAASRMGHVEDEQASSYVHWSGLGGFKTLSDSEKQFLILKSLLLMGGRAGGLMIDEEEWFSLSQVFRSRAESLARSITHREIWLKNRALYFAPHLWSDAGTLWDELLHRVGPGARLVSSIEMVLQEQEARLLIVDPALILTQETVQKLVGWARGGRVVVLPRSPLYTESARAELEASMTGPGGMTIKLGLSYKVQPVAEGRIVLYDLPEGLSMQGETLSIWQSFLTSVLSVAGVEPICSASDARLRLIPLEKKGGGIGLFIMNGTGRRIAADLLFAGEVTVSDLAAAFVPVKGGRESVLPANRFTLEVPPCGVMPLSVDGLGADAQERRTAALTSQLLRAQVVEAAATELPGFAASEDMGTPWS